MKHWLISEAQMTLCLGVELLLIVNYAASLMTRCELIVETKQPISYKKEDLENPIEYEIGIRII